jgi:hypothetical protein
MLQPVLYALPFGILHDDELSRWENNEGSRGRRQVKIGKACVLDSADQGKGVKDSLSTPLS